MNLFRITLVAAVMVVGSASHAQSLRVKIKSKTFFNLKLKYSMGRYSGEPSLTADLFQIHKSLEQLRHEDKEVIEPVEITTKDVNSKSADRQESNKLPANMTDLSAIVPNLDSNASLKVITPEELTKQSRVLPSDPDVTVPEAFKVNGTQAIR